MADSYARAQAQLRNRGYNFSGVSMSDPSWNVSGGMSPSVQDPWSWTQSPFKQPSLSEWMLYQKNFVEPALRQQQQWQWNQYANSPQTAGFAAFQNAWGNYGNMLQNAMGQIGNITRQNVQRINEARARQDRLDIVNAMLGIARGEIGGTTSPQVTGFNYLDPSGNRFGGATLPGTVQTGITASPGQIYGAQEQTEATTTPTSTNPSGKMGDAPRFLPLAATPATQQAMTEATGALTPIATSAVASGEFTPEQLRNALTSVVGSTPNLPSSLPVGSDALAGLTDKYRDVSRNVANNAWETLDRYGTTAERQQQLEAQVAQARATNEAQNLLNQMYGSQEAGTLEEQIMQIEALKRLLYS